MSKGILILSLMLITIFAFSSICFANEFPDVDASHWAHKYIDELSTKGVINGYSDGTYKPNGTVKRSEFIKLAMALFMPAQIDESGLGTVLDHWAGKYVRYAGICGVIDEDIYTIDYIEQPITRIEMASIIAYSDINIKGNKINDSQELSFSDIEGINPKVLDTLKHTVARGLITGYEDGTFKPEKTVTRAEAATMIWRLMNTK